MICLWIQWKSAASSQNPNRKKQLLLLLFTSCTASCLMQTLKTRSNWHQNLLRLGQGGLLLELWKEGELYPVLLLVGGVFRISDLEHVSQGRNWQCLETCVEITECRGHWWIPAPWKTNADNISKATGTIFSFTHSESYLSNKAYEQGMMNRRYVVISQFSKPWDLACASWYHQQWTRLFSTQNRIRELSG